ncbi:hypothetical protein J2S90_002337 [Arthrobacter bambusae]|uniref:Smf/DprA SLOG domain-containing protein n=1 Tax=Arthrobacter bambusae TaxID=1338426 RepID=A0AAW8DIE6_9MICC|nr:hypothetical protein [Arthrobacter bambusae]MDQ0129151.1 hypothetical protein [Arthrobacter bambusae]MDQ0180503.1 hypothetical protein [Arthrobacter bambusae]
MSRGSSMMDIPRVSPPALSGGVVSWLPPLLELLSMLSCSNRRGRGRSSSFWRSGALNTAQHAGTIARHVAAVPGGVHSANSARCRRLRKEGGAVMVTDAVELSEMLAG